MGGRGCGGAGEEEVEEGEGEEGDEEDGDGVAPSQGAHGHDGRRWSLRVGAISSCAVRSMQSAEVSSKMSHVVLLSNCGDAIFGTRGHFV